MKKTFRMLAMFVVAFLATATITSCDDDDDWVDPICPNGAVEAIVTTKTDPATGQPYMQLNDSITLVPTNIKQWATGNKEMRAYVYYLLTDSASGHYSHAVHVYLQDTIRTKMMSPKVEDMNKVYGNDPLEVVNSWETVCEDGYLTIRFRTYFGGQKVHSLYLVRTGDDTVELRHNANGDAANVVNDGIIAFRLNDMPDTEGKYKELTLKWKSFSGEKSVKFRYKTR